MGLVISEDCSLRTLVQCSFVSRSLPIVFVWPRYQWRIRSRRWNATIGLCSDYKLIFRHQNSPFFATDFVGQGGLVSRDWLVAFAAERLEDLFLKIVKPTFSRSTTKKKLNLTLIFPCYGLLSSCWRSSLLSRRRKGLTQLSAGMLPVELEIHRRIGFIGTVVQPEIV
jgi:hypothetical protein